MIIAIDGFAASGKGTLAKRIARHLSYHFLDTGALYRIVAYLVKQKGLPFDDTAAAHAVATHLTPEQIHALSDSPLIRTEDISQGSSIVAAMVDAVRTPLIDFQRTFAKQAPGTVIDGRDIGTFICPDADVKLFITAGLDVRAARRHKEQLAKGIATSLDEIKAEMAIRDKRDSVRTHPVFDSIVIDTSDLTPDDVFAEAMVSIQKKMP